MSTVTCPYCESVGKIEECHPFSSDAGMYFVCDECDHEFTPEEYEALLDESDS